jgi:hypothetical protein
VQRLDRSVVVVGSGVLGAGEGLSLGVGDALSLGLDDALGVLGALEVGSVEAEVDALVDAGEVEPVAVTVPPVQPARRNPTAAIGTASTSRRWASGVLMPTSLARGP